MGPFSANAWHPGEGKLLPGLWPPRTDPGHGRPPSPAAAHHQPCRLSRGPCRNRPPRRGPSYAFTRRSAPTLPPGSASPCPWNLSCLSGPQPALQVPPSRDDGTPWSHTAHLCLRLTHVIRQLQLSVHTSSYTKATSQRQERLLSSKPSTTRRAGYRTAVTLGGQRAHRSGPRGGRHRDRSCAGSPASSTAAGRGRAGSKAESQAAPRGPRAQGRAARWEATGGRWPSSLGLSLAPCGSR